MEGKLRRDDKIIETMYLEGTCKLALSLRHIYGEQKTGNYLPR